jgi:undecaprenyl-diphosphatase
MALFAHHALPGTTHRRLPVIAKPGRRGLALTFGVAFLLLLIDAIVNPRAFFDLWTIQAIQRLDAPGLHPFFQTVERLTNSEGTIATWALALLLFFSLRWWAPAVALGLMPLGGIVNEGIGKLLVDRERPHLAELTRTSSNWEERSFPSGHVMGAVMFWGLLFVVARRIGNRPLRLTVQTVSAIVFATVGIERLWEGAHWPTDVLGAYTLGGLFLVGLIAIYHRVDAATAGLPFIHAAPLSHNATRPHAHALTSLVLFGHDRVTKIYNPGFLPRALYWLAFQAEFPYIRNRAALDAAMHRRNLAATLSEYWFGSSRIARVLGIERVNGHPAVVSELVAGHTPTNRQAAKTFLTRLRFEFEQAGLPTWQIDPRQPRAVDNVLELPDGTFRIVDLESGLVSPLASLTTWRRALRRGSLPLFDDVFFDVTRAYIAREEERMRAQFGDTWVADLKNLLDEAETATATWHASEPRLLHRALHAVVTGFGVTTWRSRLRTRTAGSREKAQVWMDRAVATWETDGRISPSEAAELRTQMTEPTFQAMLPYLGAHFLISIPLRFPLGSIVRPILVAGALATATGRFLTGRIDREEWTRARGIHSPLVIIFAGVPAVGSFAYLTAKPVRANRLLLRTLGDAVLQKIPWHLYQRTGLRRLVARPVQHHDEATAEPIPSWPYDAGVATGLATEESAAGTGCGGHAPPVRQATWAATSASIWASGASTGVSRSSTATSAPTRTATTTP